MTHRNGVRVPNALRVDRWRVAVRVCHVVSVADLGRHSNTPGAHTDVPNDREASRIRG